MTEQMGTKQYLTLRRRELEAEIIDKTALLSQLRGALAEIDGLLSKLVEPEPVPTIGTAQTPNRSTRRQKKV